MTTIAEYKSIKAERKASRPKFSECLFTPGTKFHAPYVAKQYGLSTDVVFTVKNVGRSTVGSWVINCEPIPGFNDCYPIFMSNTWVTEIISRGNRPWTIESHDYYRASKQFFDTNSLCFTGLQSAKRKMILVVQQVLETKNLTQADDYCTGESISRMLEKDGFFKTIKKVPYDQRSKPHGTTNFTYTIKRTTIKRLKKWAVANQRRILNNHASAYENVYYFDDGSPDLEIYGKEKDRYDPELDLYSDSPGLRDASILDTPKVLEGVPQSTTAKKESWVEVNHCPGGFPKGATVYVSGSRQTLTALCRTNSYQLATAPQRKPFKPMAETFAGITPLLSNGEGFTDKDEMLSGVINPSLREHAEKLLAESESVLSEFDVIKNLQGKFPNLNNQLAQVMAVRGSNLDIEEELFNEIAADGIFAHNVEAFEAGLKSGASDEPNPSSESTSPRLSDEFTEDDHDFRDNEGQ